MNDFVHLHVHTEYSLLGSTIKLDRLLAGVEALNMDGDVVDFGDLHGGFINNC
jgi:DNA polymerase III alpha subunit